MAFDNPIVAPLILRARSGDTERRRRAGDRLGPVGFCRRGNSQKQAIKLAEQAKEAEKKLSRSKNKKKRKQRGGGAGPGRRGRGPARKPTNPSTQPTRSAHLITGYGRPTGNMLQGGERIERAYWACVVAKVPIREQ
jgi:hypothetical protein